jgi:DNA transposition AAA+ family ATPase
MYKENLKKYLAETGDSQNNLAKKIGVSPATLSQYLSGTYKTPAAVEPQIQAFFNIAEDVKKHVNLRPDFTNTTVSKAVLNAIYLCFNEKSMGIIYGDAGVGKTTAIKHFEKEYPETLLVRASISISNQVAFLQFLGRRLKCGTAKRLSELYLDLVDKLDGSNKILIIDEAQHLPYKTLEILRDLHDECNIPIVLVGNKEVYSKLLGKGEAAFAQLFSRAAIRTELSTSNIQKKDIVSLFPTADDGAIKLLHKIAQTRWGLRGAVNTFQNAANHGDITEPGLHQMMKIMGIAV